MFTVEELDGISAALIVQIKSVQRLANKEGQPASVADEYRKVYKKMVDLSVKVVTIRDDLKRQVKK